MDNLKKQIESLRVTKSQPDFFIFSKKLSKIRSSRPKYEPKINKFNCCKFGMMKNICPLWLSKSEKRI